MNRHSPGNVRELLELRADEAPEKEFLVSEADGRKFTYGDFDSAVNRTANLLLSRGVRKGDRVSLFLTNRVEYFILYFACFKIGAWAGPVNALLKPPEIKPIVENSKAALAVTDLGLYPALKQACARVASLREIVLVDAGFSEGGVQCRETPEATLKQPAVYYSEEVAKQRDALESCRISPNDEAVIIHTSGTTGGPKGVLLTHGNLLANAQHIAEWLHLSSQDRAMMIMPLFHVNALMTTGLAALWAGGSVLLAPRFSASRHWEAISRHNVTYFGSVATMLSMLNHSYPDGLPEAIDTSRLRFALCGSAPVPVEVMRLFETRFRCPVIEGYGLSESTCRSTFNPTDERRRPGSIGLPIGNEIKVFDEGDNELEPGRVGEIVLRGPNIMKGYYRDSAATRQAFRSGWFHTGDLGYRDQDGFFYVVDRKSDMITRGGEKVYPREVDEVLYQCPKVKDAATVGVPDPIYGEEVKSFVVLREGEQATEEEIINFCRARLADFKCPESVRFLDQIPKGPTGKLVKRELVTRFLRDYSRQR